MLNYQRVTWIRFDIVDWNLDLMDVNGLYCGWKKSYTSW
jgi:hypothetical protein